MKIRITTDPRLWCVFSYTFWLAISNATSQTNPNSAHCKNIVNIRNGQFRQLFHFFGLLTSALLSQDTFSKVGTKLYSLWELTNINRAMAFTTELLGIPDFVTVPGRDPSVTGACVMGFTNLAVTRGFTRTTEPLTPSKAKNKYVRLHASIRRW